MKSRKTKWVGIDRDLETSLFDYGLVAVQKPDHDYPDEWFVVYKISKNQYGTSHIRESELHALIDGKEWADKDDIHSFLKYVGTDAKQWKDMSFISKMNDVISYWGADNITGTDYYPIDIKGLIRLSHNFEKKYGSEYLL